LGHIGTFQTDLGAARKFYVDHHVVALIPEAARQSLGWHATGTTVCVGVELCSYEQLRAARAQLLEQGVTQGPSLPAVLRPGIDHAAFFVDPSGHTVMLYFSMEQVGWDGRPRPASERRVVQDEWPETIGGGSDTYYSQLLQGPLG
jgi:hypothetical protein